MPVTTTCTYCKKQINKKPGQIKKNNFCNKPCYNKWRQENKGTPKDCKECGKQYKTATYRANQSSFCSIPCLNRNNAKKAIKHPPKTCTTCGKKFFTRSRATCSPQCSKQPRGKRITIQCQNCGKKIEVLPSRVSGRKFCNSQCNNEYRTGKHRKNPLQKTCPICKKPFTTYPSRQEKKYCKQCDGRRHENAYSDTRIKGKKHNWFIGTTERKYGRNWEKQAEKARKRDKYRCRVCGYNQEKNSRKLSVHHIIPRREFKSLESLETKGNALKNLITLCQSCHMKAELGTIPIQLHLY